MSRGYKKFEDLVFGEDVGYSVGFNKARIFFPNGYGVSVVDTFSSDDNGYELAVLKGDEEKNEICYDTYLTNDVIKNQDKKQVTWVMRKVQDLTF